LLCASVVNFFCNGAADVLKTKTSRTLILLIAPVLSGALLVLAFPDYDLAWLAWVGLVPLLLTIYRRSLAYAFFSSFACGLIFFAGVFNFMLEIPGYMIYHQAILVIFLGLYFGVFGLIVCFISNRLGGAFGQIAAPFVWVSFEYVRSNLGFMALPWALLAHSQYQYLTIIQVSSLAGAYSVSFLLVLVNSTIAAGILTFLLLSKSPKHPDYVPLPREGTVTLILATIVLAGLSFLYGKVELSKPVDGKRIRVSVVQGNIDREKKGNPRKHAKFIFQKYANLTKKAALDRPALIVWPEAATPGFILKNVKLLKQMRILVGQTKTHFLVGSSEYAKFSKVTLKRGKIGNSALFFSPKEKVIGQYLKIRLLPFGEYVPYKDFIPWPHFIVPKEKKSWEVPGRKYMLFEVDGARFGVLICWEVVFPELVRKFLNSGANLMINISNEGWFGGAEPYQMLAINVYRAVENRISLARTTNTGISCFIDRYGRVTGRVRNNDKEIFVEGYLTQETTLLQKRSFYTNYGYLFVYLTLIVTCFLIALSLLSSNRSISDRFLTFPRTRVEGDVAIGETRR
jgi:apolipoprotein N-acyltransferase